MTKIYILHQYGDESHFKALLEEGKKNGVTVSKQYILTYRGIVKHFFSDLSHKKYFGSIENLLVNLFLHFKIRTLKNQILIVGVAPYDFILNKYKKVFSKNISYYYTSNRWDGTDIVRGDKKNKEDFEKILKECFAGAFCVSQYTSENLKHIFKRRVVVNHSIDYDDYIKKNKFPEKNKKFVFVGRYVQVKNIDLIIEWINNNPDKKFEFDFIGEGVKEDKINQLIQKDKRVHNLGFKSKDYLKKNLCTYDFFVLPSIYEPFGISLLEALASGLPCIVSNAIGPSEIIDDSSLGYVFDLNDQYNNFSKVMNMAMNIDNSLYKSMSKACINRGKIYSTEYIFKKWESMLTYD